jgi:hypothetical protein
MIMRDKLIMENENFHLLPKAVRRLLVHSETFFFTEAGADQQDRLRDEKPVNEDEAETACA